MKILPLLAVSAMTISVLTACQPTPTNEQTNNPISDMTMAKNMPLTYPDTRTGDVVDTYFGTAVADPYRWLEDDRSAETGAWVKAQNEVTQAYFAQIPYRDKIEQVVTDLINYERISSPFKEGDYTYFYKNDGLQNQSVVYRQKANEAVEVFIDPNNFSADGTVSLAGMYFSDDGQTLAYMTSTGGSDWREVYVMDAQTKTLIGEPLQDVKFSGISWYKNAGFYYSSYDKPTGSELSDKTDQHKVYYHELGTAQRDDKAIFGHTQAEKHRYIGTQVSEDNRYLFVSAANSTSGNRAYVKDLTQPDSQWQTVKQDIASDVYMLTNKGSTLYLVTNEDAPNTKIIKVDVSAPDVSNWIDVIPETEHVLSPSYAGGTIFAEYMVDAISKVSQYDLSGTKIRDIELPGVGTVGSF